MLTNVICVFRIADHWIPLFVPIVGIIAAIILLIVVYRYTPACVFFKGKSYVVKSKYIRLKIFTVLGSYRSYYEVLGMIHYYL